MKQPKSTAFTALRLPADLLVEIQRIATVQGVSVSALIKAILSDYVKQKQDKSGTNDAM
jgi:metal-responsive CopG/Arc/MetJ family transcriptional regulator